MENWDWRSEPWAAPPGEWPGARAYISFGGEILTVVYSLRKDRNFM